MFILQTKRLILREVVAEDASFILQLLNEPSFLHFIGDRGVKSLENARRYIFEKMIHSYKQFGFGMYLVELKESKLPIGLCGLVKRDYLQDVDVGFAFIPKFWGQGYAHESTVAIMKYAREKLQLERIVAITADDNQSSIKLLEKLGMSFEKMIKVPGDENEIRLYQ